MTANLRSWWQKARKPLEVFGIIVVCILMIVLFVVIVLAYIFNVNVPGLRGKTLWDWLQLLIVPFALAIVALVFQLANTRTEYQIALDNQREAALQAYIDRVSELLLEKKLRESAREDEVRVVAWVRTMSILPRLDVTRKSSVLLFLHESGLIERGKCIIDLGGANLIGANLQTDNLSGANLRKTNLSGANLWKTNLSGADLSEANLKGATGITVEELEKQAYSLKGAIMPDGSKHP